MVLYFSSMYTHLVDHIRCGGCKHTIEKSLSALGATDILIDIEAGSVSYESSGDPDEMIRELSRLGYPLHDSDGSHSLRNKARSYLSCALGKVG